MSDHKPKKTTGNRPPRAFGWMAEFANEHRMLEAARKVRDSGYTDTDAFTPFPVHGIDEALGIKPTKLPFIVLCCGLTGLSLALLMQWWMNGVDYKYIISGKPFGITPASIPVAFEMTILFSAFSTFLGMIALNGLPRFSNPVFTSPRFDRATDDKFFLYVSAKDKYYNRESVKELLSGTHPDHLEEVIEDATPDALPRAIWLGALLLILAGLIPAMIVLNMRAGYSTQPRFHVFFDMDFQPKKKAQQTTTIFADGRAMRPQVNGTVARGQFDESDAFYLGYDPDKVAALSVASGRYVAAQEGSAQEGTQPPADATAAEPAAAQPPATETPAPVEPMPADAPQEQPAAVPATPVESAAPQAAPAADQPPADGQPAAPATPALPWLDQLPLEANDELMRLGESKYRVYCSACHGYSGYGDGLVSKRATALVEASWTPPASLHSQAVRNQPVGQVFHTIGQGKGKMPGYGFTLSAKERWAIVLYVKALQKSRNATLDDVPVEKRNELQADPASAPKQTAEPASAEKK